ncbi:TPA: hypothetical protein ACW0I5_004743 [Escherichia coli]
MKIRSFQLANIVGGLTSIIGIAGKGRESGAFPREHVVTSLV